MKRRKRVVIILSAVVLLPCLCFAGLAIYIQIYGQVDRAQPAQAIVVLGAKVQRSGQPGASLRARTLRAVALYRRGLAPKIICTGGIGSFPPAESQASATLAEAQGVPVEDLLLESKSRSTMENARYAADICRAHGWTRVIVVSDPYHLFRARRDFERFGVIAYPSPALEGQSDRNLRYRMTLREAWLVMEEALHL
ncbi:MAG TPA: YdcF family protein [Chthonomonadaceae bacterium]|nr:YdcF family protein [Chthonomonadaceae bacterium]